MSLVQFLRILWSRRWLTLATTAFTVLGAGVAVLIVPPNYEASSRVLLNTLKPDPVTGQAMPISGSRTFVAQEIELIKDYSVVGKAVDQLGWASNPSFVEQYQNSKLTRIDIRRWLSQRVIDHTKVEMVNMTNILEISYSGSSPEEAKAMADALRNNYVDTTLENRRRDASRNAEWYEQQAAKEQALLSQADAAKTAYEKANGIVMQSDNTDVDTARLRALSQQGGVSTPVFTPPPAPTSASVIQLAQLDATIAQAAQSLGPNHPQMVELRARRALLAKVAAEDQAAARASASAAAGAAGASAGALERAVRSQTSRVIAKRDQIERLSQLQAEVNLRRDQYTKSITRAAQLRQEAAVADSGVTILGDAAMPQKAKFPNIPLIMGGAPVMGFALGVLLSLLTELFARRVRGPEDMRSAFDVPLLAIISPANRGGMGLQSRLGPQLKLPNRRRAVQV